MMQKVTTLTALQGFVTLVVSGYLSALQPAFAQENGAEVFKKCRACHQLGADAKNAVGPRLTGIVGRKAASAESFNYSDAMKAAGAAGMVWDEATIDKYLANPKGFIPGNKMIFVGVPDEPDRRDLIAFLKGAGGS